MTYPILRPLSTNSSVLVDQLLNAYLKSLVEYSRRVTAKPDSLISLSSNVIVELGTNHSPRPRQVVGDSSHQERFVSCVDFRVLLCALGNKCTRLAHAVDGVN